jgi:predicted RNA binding protein with dsRBD fold (UPF0201 family)
VKQEKELSKQVGKQMLSVIEKEKLESSKRKQKSCVKREREKSKKSLMKIRAVQRVRIRSAEPSFFEECSILSRLSVFKAIAH